ncbi:hypothetical protein EJB05_22795, partial [Eragrostis curvula]
MASRAPPPRRRRSHGPTGAPGKGSTSVTVSPLGPELQTRVWLEFFGFPSHLWSAPGAATCLVQLGALLTRFDAAEFRRSGRMVAEANVTRVAAVPKWTVVLESGVPDLPPGQQFLRHSAEPVFVDEAEGSKGKNNNNKNRFVRPPSAQAAERKVGFEERPDTFCVLNRNDVRL